MNTPKNSNPSRRRLGATVLCLALLGLGACAGAEATVCFDEARYPVSLTSALLDEDGAELGANDYEVVGAFEATEFTWSILWNMIDVDVADFSDELNEQVEAARGEAVVNLRVSGSQTIYGQLTLWTLTHWLPVVPGSAHASVTGDIVRRRAEGD